MERIIQLQASRNAETLGGWNCFTSHRERVAQLLLDAASVAEGNLCVFGAGNCNDLDLNQLTDSFSQIDLVDIDDQAVTAGIARQDITSSRVVPHGGVDVTGVAELMSAWKPDQPADEEQVETCIANARRFVLPLNASGYSAATSTCILSQLIGSITLTLGVGHPRFFDLLACLRREHIRQLVDLTMPGGTVVLFTDVVSSLTLPELAKAATSELPRVVGHAIAHRNFFTGVNPVVIKHLLETDASFATQLTEVRLSDPWVWDLGPRLYAVIALTATRL